MGVFVLREHAERLAEVLLVEANHVSVLIAHAIVALHHNSGLAPEQAIFHARRRDTARRRELQAYELIECF